MSDRILWLNGLRGWAFLSVFVEHACLRYDILISIGQGGVALFFFLSAFLLIGQLYKRLLEGKPINLLNYYFRRFFRIYPTLLLFLLIDVLLVQRIVITAALEVFFLLRPYYEYWTIYVEYRAYVIFPLVAFAAFRVRLKYFFVFIALIILGFIGTIAYLTFAWSPPYITTKGVQHDNTTVSMGMLANNILFVVHLPYFLVGGAVAIAFQHIRSNSLLYKWKIPCTLLVLNIMSVFFLLSYLLTNIVVGIVFFILGKEPVIPYPHENFSILYILCFSGLFFILKRCEFTGEANIIKWFLETRVMCFLGDVSFPGYLSHSLIFSVNHKYFEGEYIVLRFLIWVTGIVLSVSYAIHLYIELPIMHKTRDWGLPRITDIQLDDVDHADACDSTLINLSIQSAPTSSSVHNNSCELQSIRAKTLSG